jgi:hypothetical protein
MRKRADASRYLQSLAAELTGQADCVRNLIGDSHWLHDGRHKERLLLHLVRRHCPAVVASATGFVVNPDLDACSREQDIVIADCRREAPIFHNGDLLIATPRNVLAAISVKTTCDITTFRDSAYSLYTVREIAASAGVNPSSIWTGAFFFNDLEPIAEPKLLQWYEIVMNDIPPLAFNGTNEKHIPISIVATARTVALITHKTTGEQYATVRQFDCNGLATAVFVADLVDHVAVSLGAQHAEFADFVDIPGIRLSASLPIVL